MLALWVFFFSRHGRLDVRHEEGSAEHAIETKRLEAVSDILMIGNDIQMMTGPFSPAGLRVLLVVAVSLTRFSAGIALMITAFVVSKNIDLYHLHMIYDTVSFVGCA